MDLNELAQQLYPILNRMRLQSPTIWGDPSRVTIGKNCSLANAFINVVSGRLTIEDEAFCGQFVRFLAAHHDYRKTGLERQTAIPPEGHDIVVRRGAWIGANVTVIGPCEIGENTVVGASSVVVHGTLEPNSIYAGVPARFIRKIEGL